MVSMNEREQLIEKLVTTMHLSMPERLTLSPNVRYAEVAAAVARVLENSGYFPPGARPWQEGNLVHEGAILQRLSNRRFRLILQRGHPTNPAVLALWERYAACCDYVTLGDLAEAGIMFPGFELVET